jgi:translation initiation factor 2 alpha subunit (eIF-2alpha)
LGESGIAKLSALSVALHADKVKKAKKVMVAITVQEKNIPLPTDAQLDQQVMKLRPSYRLVVQRLDYAQGDAHLARHAKKAQRALKKLSTLAGSSASS